MLSATNQPAENTSKEARAMLDAIGAATVAAPAAGTYLAPTILGLITAMSVAFTYLHRKKAGVEVGMADTPRTLWIAIGIAVALFVLTAISFVLAFLGNTSPILWLALLGLVTTFVGSAVAERVHQQELRRGR